MRVTVITTVHDDVGNLVEAHVQVRNKTSRGPDRAPAVPEFSTATTPTGGGYSAQGLRNGCGSTSRKFSTALTCLTTLAFTAARLAVEFGPALFGLVG